MAEITFIVDPGADDILIDGVSLNDIDAFRDECLTGGAVSCDWDTLHARLINHDISRFWWFLTEAERRSIAEIAIKNTLFYTLYYGRSGKPNCEGGEGDVAEIVCMQNALIRYLKFGSDSPPSGSDCYYRRNSDSDEFCYVPDIKYNLPCNIVLCAGYDFGHSMCAIQVVDSFDSLDNWIVFQYSSFDIKPGNPQMPNNDFSDLFVKMEVITTMRCSGYRANEVARWDI